MHGTTVHGIEWTDWSEHLDPGSYYSSSGRSGDIVPASSGPADPSGADIRVSGWVPATLAWYTSPGDR